MAVLLLFSVLIIPQQASFAATVQLPQTGQTGCWDKDGNAISCIGTGQDGDKQMGAAWSSPRFTDNGDQTLTDNLTGLIWTKDANAPGPAACGSSVIKWWTEALDYVTCLNSNTYLGYSDWRMPNRKELKSLVNRQQAANFSWLTGQGFSNVQTIYWSSSSATTSTAWIVGMRNGYVRNGHKECIDDGEGGCENGAFHVWPVRGGDGGDVWLPRTGQTDSYAAGDDGALQKGAPWDSATRFTDNGNGTVADNLTGLIWLTNANCTDTVGGISKAAGPLVWAAALTWSNHLSSGACGLSDGSVAGDWRLPNVEELESLADLGSVNQWLPSGHPFVNVQGGYWSSSTNVHQKTSAWASGKYVEFVPKTQSYIYVWPVRGGQSGSSGPLYANFTGKGIYEWAGTAWNKINIHDAASMVASRTDLYVDLPGYGLYQWNGTVWSKISPLHPSKMVVSGKNLYMYCTGKGLYQWNGTAWKKINIHEVTSMVASGRNLYVDLAGYGLYQWNGTVWSKISPLHPSRMVVSGINLYMYCTGKGLYQWNGAWKKININEVTSMVASGKNLYVDLAGYGLYQWNGTAWSKISPLHPSRMVVSGTNLYMYCTGKGIYQWNGAWKKININEVTSMVASVKNLYVDLAGYGLYQWNGTAWSKISARHPSAMVVFGNL